MFNSRRKAIIFLFLALFAVWWFGRPVAEYFNRVERIESLQEEVASLEEKRNALAGEVGYMESLEYVEKEARNKLNMIFPGEKVLIIPESEEEAPDSEATSALQEDKPNWEQWRDLFFN